MQGILEGAASAGAKLVYGDNLYLYGRVRGPMTEDLPSAAATVKGRVRAQVAAELLAAHEVGRVRATIGRASDFYGPRVLVSTLGEQVFSAALAGKPANLLGNVDLPHTYTYIGDFARGLVTLGERDEALGWAWHVPSAETRTTRELVEMTYREAGHPAKVRVAGRTLVAVMSWFSPMMRELREMLYQSEEPFVMDGSRFDRAFTAVATPHEEAVRRTMSWYRSRMAGKSLSESSGR
jgi:nucleoside-diphosphate-sugar epimerase